MAIKTQIPVGILGATGMVGQRYIQLLENHPWFEVAWLAASDRSSGKKYGEAANWRLDTPMPKRIAEMTVRPADPFGAPKVIFASVDAAYARELEPRFAEAGCATSPWSSPRSTPTICTSLRSSPRARSRVATWSPIPTVPRLGW
jgi:aspartate-semialdehyde dehydrogenase